MQSLSHNSSSENSINEKLTGAHRIVHFPKNSCPLVNLSKVCQSFGHLKSHCATKPLANFRPCSRELLVFISKMCPEPYI